MNQEFWRFPCNIGGGGEIKIQFYHEEGEFQYHHEKGKGGEVQHHQEEGKGGEVQHHQDEGGIGPAQPARSVGKSQK